VTNLGKPSVTLNLQSVEGKDADVFIENFRTCVTNRLGFSHGEVSKVSPKAIYLSITGFGNGGLRRERPTILDT
jgi:crotonobetainyl-CoA:carnitine CoA-transferase CaiB-like acyl-CoA transferase